MDYSEAYVENVEEVPVIDTPTVTDADPAHQAVRKQGWIERTPFNYEELSAKEGHDWASNAARYEWKGEYDESAIGPRNEELEKMLFDSDLIPRAGIRVSE
jgi:ATP-dependent RNA helicase DDX3X